MRIDQLRPSPDEGPQVKFGQVTDKGVFPEGAYLTTNQIEFLHDGERGWVLPSRPRMDGVVRRSIAPDGSPTLEIVEGNKLHVGDEVVLSTTDDGSEGVYVTNFSQPTTEPLGSMAHHANMEFNTAEGSSERIVSYKQIADILDEAKGKSGKIIWVLGPAVDHAGGINDAAWFVKHGYVGALLAGNALAAHDIEHAMLGTSLGVNDRSEAVHNGHRNHLETINRVRRAGSIRNAVEQGVQIGTQMLKLDKGIMYECVINNVPFVLAPSPRDDGPLPDVKLNELEAQDAMREHTINASLVIMGATMLHSIATGNMTPTYRVDGDEINPIPVICIDINPAVVTKLSDRGTSQAVSVISSIPDFLARLRAELESRHPELQERRTFYPGEGSAAM